MTAWRREEGKRSARCWAPIELGYGRRRGHRFSAYPGAYEPDRRTLYIDTRWKPPADSGLLRQVNDRPATVGRKTVEDRQAILDLGDIDHRFPLEQFVMITACAGDPICPRCAPYRPRTESMSRRIQKGTSSRTKLPRGRTVRAYSAKRRAFADLPVDS